MFGKWEKWLRGSLLATVLGLIVSLLSMHLIWSQIVVSIIQKYYSQRMPIFARLPDEKRSWVEYSNAYFHEFVKSAKPHAPSVMFVGSSFTYGYPWQRDAIFSHLVADKLKNHHVGNLSVTGAGLQGIVDLALCPQTSSKIPDILIVEIPLVNSVASTVKWPKPDWIEKCHPKASSYEYASMVLARAWGVAWLRFLWDDEAYFKPDEELKVPRVPKDYFSTKIEFDEFEGRYIEGLNIYFDYVSKLGRNVFVYVSPIHTPVIEEAGGDQPGVEYQINLSYETCKRHGKVICLDASPFNKRRELFYNLTHLNQRGHRAMAQWFEEIIVRQGPTPPLPALPSPSK